MWMCVRLFFLFLFGNRAVLSLKVAVVGAGIGGGSFSYYLEQNLPAGAVEIEVFEARDYIGGRLKHFTENNVTMELGGDAWSSVNQYVIQLYQKFFPPKEHAALNTRKQPTRTETAIMLKGTRNSSGIDELYGDPLSGFAVYTGPGQFLKPFHIAAANFLSSLRLVGAEHEFLQSLKKNYATRGLNGTFDSIEDFLACGGLDAWTEQTTSHYFQSEKVAAQLETQFVEPLTRVIYDQGPEEHAFASMVSLTSFVNPGSVDTGNSILVEKLFKASGAKVHLQTGVKVITKTVDGYALQSDSGEHFSADLVVLACPFEFLNITFAQVDLPEIKLRPFTHWFVTVVRAQGINPGFFGLSASSFPFSDVLTTANATLPFNVLQLQATLPDNTSYYKMFSNSDITVLLPQIFKGVVSSRVQHWPYTFPHFTVTSKTELQPLKLDSGIFYLNAMESVASAMETSVIAARNAALLVAKQFG